MKRIALLSLSLAVGACGNEEPGRLPSAGEPVAVTLSQAAAAPSIQGFPATVLSERTAEIATRMSGTVERVHVEIGTRVAAGQPLVTLDATDVEARVEAATAQLRLAERSFARIERLAGDGAASQQELDQARAALEGARAQAAEATAQRAYAIVSAPFAGVVTNRSVDAGDLALPGVPLLTVVAPGALKAVADLPAERIGLVSVGDVVTVELPGVATPAQATVTRAAPALSGASRTFRVEARLAEGATAGVVPGAYARMRLASPSDGSTWIPADAVIERGQLTGVFSVEGDALRLRWVRLGQRRDGAVELLSGPEAPFAVVRSPAPEWADGTPVRGATTTPWSPEAAAGTEEAIQ